MGAEPTKPEPPPIADDATRSGRCAERTVSRTGHGGWERLRKSSDFQRVYHRRCAAGDAYLLVFVAENPEGKQRLGVSVSRKWGNAVKRNRIKRLFREAFRLNKHVLPPATDFVLVPRTSRPVSLEQWEHSLRQLAQRAVRKLTASRGTDHQEP